jgi:Cys-tRNA(Pro)/Cys-tRNA(Cys) deacylase
MVNRRPAKFRQIGMPTRAIKFLQSRKIEFVVKTYAHEEKGAVFASEAIGFPLERTIKTLVVGLGQNKHILVLMPGGQNLSMKRLAGWCSVKKAAMAEIPTAERLTGYSVGGISPFGVKKSLPTVMDANLLKYSKVAINGGKRGIMLILDPQDIVSVLNCRTIPIS